MHRCTQLSQQSNLLTCCHFTDKQTMAQRNEISWGKNLTGSKRLTWEPLGMERSAGSALGSTVKGCVFIDDAWKGPERRERARRGRKSTPGRVTTWRSRTVRSRKTANVARAKRKGRKHSREGGCPGRQSPARGWPWGPECGVRCVLICLYIVQSLFLVLHTKSLNGRNHLLRF